MEVTDTKYWNEFISKYGNSDWNDPLIRCIIKDYFNKCTSAGFDMALDAVKDII